MADINFSMKCCINSIGESRGRIEGADTPTMRNQKRRKCRLNALSHYPHFHNF